MERDKVLYWLVLYKVLYWYTCKGIKRQSIILAYLLRERDKVLYWYTCLGIKRQSIILVYLLKYKETTYYTNILAKV